MTTRAFAIANTFTGELLDPDDLPALKAALVEIEQYLSDKRRPLRPIYQTRDQIQARVAELDPITLPKRRWQTDKQQRVARCPRCAQVIEDSDSPESEKVAAAAGPAVGAEAPGPQQAPSLPAGDVDGASPAPLPEGGS